MATKQSINSEKEEETSTTEQSQQYREAKLETLAEESETMRTTQIQVLKQNETNTWFEHTSELAWSRQALCLPWTNGDL